MKNKFNLIIAILIVLLFFDVSFLGKLDAMNWPSENAVLLQNFGFNDNGKPVLGMMFNEGTNILAAESGEVIFSRDKNETVSRLPSPLGSWTAVDHEDGLISIYSRYENNSVTLTQVEKSQPIAASGISGWSEQNGFYFMIFDRRERHWINPAMIVMPAQGTRPPQILSVDFRNSQGVMMQSGSPAAPRNLNQGRYTVIVNTFSPALTGSRLAPQRIICSINGAEAASLNFETFSSRDGILMVYRNGLVPAKQVYSTSSAFEAAEINLTRGQANLEIIVQDINGNSSTLLTRLIVN